MNGLHDIAEIIETTYLAPQYDMPRDHPTANALIRDGWILLATVPTPGGMDDGVLRAGYMTYVLGRPRSISTFGREAA